MKKPEDVFSAEKKLIDKALKEHIRRYCDRNNTLTNIVQYALFPGGKRVRPLLCLEICKMLGGSQRAALAPACAIEAIHAFSLVHDDMPSMDDDDIRRGKPACHKQFGEGSAILAGDALFNLAFEIISEIKDPKRLKETLKIITKTSGIYGMIGGQQLDLENMGKTKKESLKKKINDLKTGALFQAALMCGALAARASDREIKAAKAYGVYFGEAFQIRDDIMDTEYGMEEKKAKKARLNELIKKTKRTIAIFGKKSDNLNYLCERLNA